MSTGTQIEVVMPQMGVSVSEGTITKWLKREGEPIGRDEPLLEISTDKVDTEVPSPGEGVVAKILVQEGETVDVGTVLAVIAPEGAEVSAPAPAAEPPRPATQDAADASMAAASEGVGETAPQQPAAPPPPAPAAPPAEAPSGNGRTFVSPVVARIASEHGVDPAQVPGTGAGGRRRTRRRPVPRPHRRRRPHRLPPPRLRRPSLRPRPLPGCFRARPRSR
jgi:2-oxoglutarate dehydrogenase E2 component (dihydrolipoamide succinyltransferase)